MHGVLVRDLNQRAIANSPIEGTKASVQARHVNAGCSCRSCVTVPGVALRSNGVGTRRARSKAAHLAGKVLPGIIGRCAPGALNRWIKAELMTKPGSKRPSKNQRAGPALYRVREQALTGAHELPAGAVEVRSLRAPDKATANEDSAVVVPLADGGLVQAVADGVGGARAGREASNTAVKILRDRLLDPGVAERGLRATILDALEEANAEVMGLNLGAATTLVVAEIVEGELRSYHVGDSEILGIGQRGRIKLQITPHSPTGFAVEAGILDADEALTHAERHIISNVIGAEDMRIEVGTAIPLAVRDTVVLASDGLVDNLRLGEIVDLVRTGPLATAADALIELAQKRMMGIDLRQPSKPDDLTIILYRPGQAVQEFWSKK